MGSGQPSPVHLWPGGSLGHGRAQQRRGAADLVVIESGQQVFHAAISQHLKRIEYVDEYAGRIFLPITHDPVIVIDPDRNYGRPTFRAGGAPARAVLQRLWAGERLSVLADDYGIPLTDLEQVAGERAQAITS